MKKIKARTLSNAIYKSMIECNHRYGDCKEIDLTDLGVILKYPKALHGNAIYHVEDNYRELILEKFDSEMKKHYNNFFEYFENLAKLLNYRTHRYSDCIELIKDLEIDDKLSNTVKIEFNCKTKVCSTHYLYTNIYIDNDSLLHSLIFYLKAFEVKHWESKHVSMVKDIQNLLISIKEKELLNELISDTPIKKINKI